MANINDFPENHVVHALLTDLANNHDFNNNNFRGKTLQDIYKWALNREPQPSYLENLRRLIDYGCGNFAYHDCVSDRSGFDAVVLDDCNGHRIFLLEGTRDLVYDGTSDVKEKFGIDDAQISDLENFYQQNKGNPASVHLYGNSKGGYEAEWIYAHHSGEVQHCYVINALPLKYEDLSYAQKELLNNSTKFTCIIIMNEKTIRALDYVPFLNNIEGYMNNIKFVKSKKSDELLGAHTPDKGIDDKDSIEFLKSDSKDVSVYFSRLWENLHQTKITVFSKAIDALVSCIKSVLSDCRIEIDIQSFYYQADLIVESCKSLEIIDNKIRHLYQEGLSDLDYIVKHEMISWQIRHLMEIRDYLRFTADRFSSAEDKIKTWRLE